MNGPKGSRVFEVIFGTLELGLSELFEIGFWGRCASFAIGLQKDIFIPG